MATAKISISVDFSFLLDAIERAFIRLVLHFEQVQIDEMSEEKWNWYRETLRNNGTIAGLIRDIIDTGNLRDSLEIYRVRTDAVFFYGADYAALVHQGGKNSQGGEYLARPWIDEAIESANLLETFVQFLEEELS